MKVLWNVVQEVVQVLCLVAVWLFVISLFQHSEAYAASPVRLTVEERNGVEVRDAFVRRGVPFGQGDLYSPENLVLIDHSGQRFLLQTEVLENHADGSIKWLSVAFLVSLTPNERKELTLKQLQDGAEQASDLSLSLMPGNTIVENSIIRLDIGESGIVSLRYDGKEMLGDAGSRLCVVASQENGNQVFLGNGEIQVISAGPVYVTVEVSGQFEPLNIEAEWWITVFAGSNRILSEVRFVAKDDISLDTLAQVTSFNQSFDDVQYDRTQYAKWTAIPYFSPRLVSSRRSSIYNSRDSITVVTLTMDNDKFRGFAESSSSSYDVRNGFVFRKTGNVRELTFAPIQYETSYMWYDGVSRTVTSQIVVCNGKPTNDVFDAEEKSIRVPPGVVIEPEQFVSSGVLADINKSPAVTRAIDYIKSARDERWGYFEAGSLPYWIDNAAFGQVKVSGRGVRPGETEYNLWYAQMMSGDYVLYDMIYEDAMSWADVVVYRGRLEYLVGANRGETGEQYGKEAFFHSHPYYGDPSGMYLSYVMTGHPYFGETFKLMVDHSVKSSLDFIHMGYGMPRVFRWTQGSPELMDFVESRYLIQARALNYAYRLFKEEEYREAAIKIAAWAKCTQQEPGFWYQAYYHDGAFLYQSGQNTPPVKTYIMLYGARGLCSLYKDTQDEELRSTLARFADYLLDEMQSGGWLWNPTSSKQLYETNEDGTRGNSPMQEIMAVEIMNTVYGATRNVEYLDGMLKLLRYWLASQLPGGGSVQLYNAQEYGGGSIGGPNLGNNVAQFLRISSEVSKTMHEDKELIERLGHIDLMAVFSNDAKWVNLPSIMSSNRRDLIERTQIGVSTREVTLNAYDTSIGLVVYIANHSGFESGVWTRDIEVKLDDGSSVYDGMTNVISPEGTKVMARMEQFQMRYAVQTPIRITEQDAELKVDVIDYDSEVVTLKLRGQGRVALEVSDGYFPVVEDVVYRLIVNDEERLLSTNGSQLIFDVDLGSSDAVTYVTLCEK